MEKLYSDHLGELVDRLVHHAVQGELREKAVYYLQQAAARFALHDAQAWFEQALVLLCHNFWCCIVRWQQGHRGRVCANVMAILTLSVAMELRTWRSGRIGRSTGSVTVG